MSLSEPNESELKKNQNLEEVEKTIVVAVGIVFNQQQAHSKSDVQVLIAKRPLGKPLAGFWEFPGGKVEPAERVEEALSRELKEEIGITVLEAKPVLRYSPENSQKLEKSVLLDVWLVSQFAGEPTSCEGQELQWVHIPDLVRYQFPLANYAIIEFLKKRILMKQQ